MAKRERKAYTHCVDCGKPATSKSPLSTRGLHEACAQRRMMKSAHQLQSKSGPHYERYRQSMIENARRLLDA